MTDHTVVFFLGEKFRWSLMGESEGDENDEDSVINDLEFHLDNYEAIWTEGGKAENVLEHYGWSYLRRVLSVLRNTGKARQAVEDAVAAGEVETLVFLPRETREEDASWVVKVVMSR